MLMSSLLDCNVKEIYFLSYCAVPVLSDSTEKSTVTRSSVNHTKQEIIRLLTHGFLTLPFATSQEICISSQCLCVWCLGEGV